MKLALTVVLAGLCLSCASANFTGKQRNKCSDEEPAKPVKPEPVIPPDDKPDNPAVVEDDVPAFPPSLPEECRNEIMGAGVSDEATGLTFRMPTEKLGYQEGVAACKAMGPGGSGGKLIYQGQELPEAILDCRMALGTLWLRPDAGASLWQPDVVGEEDPNTKHWIICYY